jgi:hypothetical protein
MNHILYNISIIILFFGIILMVIYITKATYTPPLKPTGIRRKYNNDIYDDNPSQIFKPMFNQPSTWSGYESVVAEEEN